MPSLPVQPHHTHPHTPLEARRLARVDGCGDCVTNVEAPYLVTSTSNGFRAAYICEDCGYAWTTDWRDE